MAKWMAWISLLVFSAGCTPFDLLNAAVPSGGTHRRIDVAYGPLSGQKLDVYWRAEKPSGAKVVVFFYGGSWRHGTKRDYRFAAEGLVSEGFIVVLPDYRKYPEVAFPAFVEDGALAVRWAAAHSREFGGDGKGVYLMGHSAGAHIAAMLALNGQYLSAVGVDRKVVLGTVGLSGPYDFVPVESDKPVFSMRPNEQTPDPTIEPISFVDGAAAPMLLVTGAKDDIVDPGNTRRLAEKIREQNGSVRVVEYPSRGHEGVVMAMAWPFRWLAPVLKDTAEFIRAH